MVITLLGAIALSYNINQHVYLIKMQFMTGIELLHVLALGCRPQGVFWSGGIQVQHAELGIAITGMIKILKL